jgi:hypothetical protein
MTDHDFMIASPADCKPDVLLLAAQNEISIVIDDGGNVILRQQDALGNDPDMISIARRNLEAFVSDLIDCALPECTFPPKWGRPPSGTLGPERPATPTSARRTPAAERQARYRERKRGGATGEPSANREATASQPRPRV